MRVVGAGSRSRCHRWDREYPAPGRDRRVRAGLEDSHSTGQAARAEGQEGNRGQFVQVVRVSGEVGQVASRQS